MELQPKEKTIIVSTKDQIHFDKVDSNDPIVVYENDKLIGFVYYTEGSMLVMNNIYDLYYRDSLEELIKEHSKYTFKILYGEKV